MTHQPRLPQAAQSPYPLHPAPMPERSEAEETAQADAGEGGEAGGAVGWASRNRAGLGAALGIGSAALVAALLYTRYNRHDERDSRASAARRRKVSSKAG
jgi:hypothetical protein